MIRGLPMSEPPGSLLLLWINVSYSIISNYIHYNMGDESTYPFPDVNRAVEI